jgi:hypothetical protein
MEILQVSYEIYTTCLVQSEFSINVLQVGSKHYWTNVLVACDLDQLGVLIVEVIIV